MEQLPSAVELERLWREGPAAPRDRGTVALICIRRGDDVHDTPARVEVTCDAGVVGDRWLDGPRPQPERQITLMNLRAARLVTAGRHPLHMPGDNFLVDLDLSVEALPAGARVRLGGAVLEISEVPHTGCKKFVQRFGREALDWVNDAAGAARRLRGVNCRVLEAGWVALGDVVVVESTAREPAA